MHESEPERLLITVREAVRILSISPRKLWDLTISGEIPCVRIGRSVRYPVADLKAWVEEHKEARS